MKLEDKTAVVTGASDGIGKQIALKLAKEHTKLAFIGRDKIKLQKTQQETMEAGSPEVKIYPCDIKNINELTVTTNTIINDFKNIHILLNVAGIWQKVDSLEKIPASVVEEVVQINLTGLIQCTRLLLPNLKLQEEAAIINVSSKSGVVSQKGQSVYSASKWGVRGFTEVLKADLKDSRIRVAAVYQSGTNTKMFEKTGDDFPVEKFTDPSDLADVIIYMLTRPKKIWLHEVRIEY